MGRSILLAAAATLALGAAPAFAQPDTRDHRKKAPEARDHRKKAPEARDHRKVMPAPGKRDHRRPKGPGAGPSITNFSPKHGAPGTQVTITGQGLRRVTKVMFGPHLVTPDSASPGQLVFTVPEVKRKGPKKIVLKHPQGDLVVGAFRTRPGERVPADRGEPPPVATPAEPEPPPAGRRPRGPDGRRWHRERATVASYAPHMGKPGTKVTIFGANFTPDIKVMYSGAEVANPRIKPGRIVFKIPKREGDGVILLQAPKRRRPLVVGPFDVKRKFDPNERKRARDLLRKRAEDRWNKRRTELAEDKAERRKAWMAREAELEQTRAERRAKRAAALRAKWQREFLSDPQVQSEMSLHAERAARLNRMRRLAEVDDRGKLVIRIDVLLQREDARHEQRMATLKANFTVE